jgi:hypothetical protein
MSHDWLTYLKHNPSSDEPLKRYCDNCRIIDAPLYNLLCKLETPNNKWRIDFVYCLDCMRTLPVDESTRQCNLCRPLPGQMVWPKIHADALGKCYEPQILYIEKGDYFEILGG